MKPLNQREFDRVLIIKPSSLGDVLHAVPVLWAVRRRWPRARISWLAGSAFAPLIESHPALDETIVFDRERYGRLGRSRRVTREFIRFVGELRRRRFDLVIDLQGLFRSGFLSWAAGSSVRIGFGQAREAAWVFYSHRIPPIRGDAHAVDRNFRVCRLLGIEDEPIDLSIAVRPEAEESVRAKLSGLGLRPGSEYLAVAPGARWETKRWVPEHIAAVIDAVHEQTGGRAVLLGSTGEQALCGQVAGLTDSEPINLAGKTSLPELAAAVGGARAVLCNDSGAKDLAVALDRPVVTIFGPTNPLRTGPYGRGRDIFRACLPCSPCYLKKLTRCPHHHRCMQEIPPSRAIERIVAHWRHELDYNTGPPRDPKQAPAIPL
jgi:lipopolysaccharide heptosyltransferase I